MSNNPLHGLPNRNLMVTASVEAFFPGTNNIINLVDMVNTGISNFTNDLAKSFSEIKTQMRSKSFTKLEHGGKLDYSRSLLSSLRIKGYLGIKEIGVQTPPGFQGNIADYINTLNNVMSLLEDFHTNYFVTAEKYLAGLLNDDRKLYTQQSFTDTKLATDINKAKETIADYFKGSQAAHLQPFGNVYRSLGEWTDSLDSFQNLLTRINAYSPDMVTKEINNLSEKADRLILKMKKNSDKEVSKATAKDVANVIYTMATAYEFYGAYIQFVNELYVAVVNLNSAIIKA